VVVLAPQLDDEGTDRSHIPLPKGVTPIKPRQTFGDCEALFSQWQGLHSVALRLVALSH